VSIVNYSTFDSFKRSLQRKTCLFYTACNQLVTVRIVRRHMMGNLDNSITRSHSSVRVVTATIKVYIYIS